MATKAAFSRFAVFAIQQLSCHPLKSAEWMNSHLERWWRLMTFAMPYPQHPAVGNWPMRI